MKRIAMIMVFSFAVGFLNGETSSTFPSDIKLKTPGQKKPDKNNICLCYNPASGETGDSFLTTYSFKNFPVYISSLDDCATACRQANWNGYIYYDSTQTKYILGEV